jgi:hypothetical protein
MVGLTMTQGFYQEGLPKPRVVRSIRIGGTKLFPFYSDSFHRIRRLTARHLTRCTLTTRRTAA